MRGKYKIADYVFDIQTMYPYIHEMCHEYKTEERQSSLFLQRKGY